jgi:hypothetical protein
MHAQAAACCPGESGGGSYSEARVTSCNVRLRAGSADLKYDLSGTDLEPSAR